MKSLLLHACCAHCASYTVDFWRSNDYLVSLFWYNPNIHPYSEYVMRKDALIVLSRLKNIPLIEIDRYGSKYFLAILSHEAERCDYCLGIRLESVARTALERGIQAFSSTLLISPFQKHMTIKTKGEELEKLTKLDFAYSDLRKHFSESRKQTKQFQLFRQTYCGCVFSQGATVKKTWNIYLNQTRI